MLLGIVSIFSVVPVVVAQEVTEPTCDRDFLAQIAPRQVFKTQTPQVFDAPILPS